MTVARASVHLLSLGVLSKHFQRENALGFHITLLNRQLYSSRLHRGQSLPLRDHPATSGGILGGHGGGGGHEFPASRGWRRSCWSTPYNAQDGIYPRLMSTALRTRPRPGEGSHGLVLPRNLRSASPLSSMGQLHLHGASSLFRR